jgi:hypothetical protein
MCNIWEQPRLSGCLEALLHETTGQCIGSYMNLAREEDLQVWNIQLISVDRVMT